MNDAGRTWTFSIPRPLSMNQAHRLYWRKAAALKAQFIEDVRWCARQAGFPRLPLQHKIYCHITIYGRWSSKAPDRGNWEKWIGDALGGFVIVDDGDEFWSYEVTCERASGPGARLFIRELPARIPRGAKIRKPAIRRRKKCGS